MFLQEDFGQRGSPIPSQPNSDAPQPSNMIELLNMNENSWLRHRDNLSGKADIVVAQET